MINSKIAHRFFIIAPVVIQSGSPHFIRLLRAENSGSIFILYTRYFPHFSISDRISFFNHNLKGTALPPTWREPSLSEAQKQSL